jgi:hypothetical protein
MTVQQCQLPRQPSHAFDQGYGVPRSVFVNFLRNSVFAAVCCAFVAAVFAALSCLFAIAMLSSIDEQHQRSHAGAVSVRGHLLLTAAIRTCNGSTARAPSFCILVSILDICNDSCIFTLSSRWTPRISSARNSDIVTRCSSPDPFALLQWHGQFSRTNSSMQSSSR